MTGHFLFDRELSKAYGIYISGSGTFNTPEADVDKMEIPGRNGDLLIDNNRFKNVTITYPAFVRRKFSAYTDSAKMWLMKNNAYRRLEDTYHPDYYRMARFSGPMDFDVRFLNKSGECELSFDCKPQRFLKLGEYAISVTGQAKLYNPTTFAAKPLIRVYGTSGTLLVGDTVMQISEIDGYVDIDCDTQNAFKGTANCNGNIRVSGFPELPAGETGIGYEGNITGIEITPRWWTI